MKICLVTLEFCPSSISGGITSQFHDLAHNLSLKGFFVHVLTVGEKDREFNLNDRLKVTQLGVPIQSKVSKIPVFQIKVNYWLKNNKCYDIIHFQESTGFFYFLSQSEENTVLTFHHSPFKEYVYNLGFLIKDPINLIIYLFSPFLFLPEIFVLFRVTKILTVSEYSKNTLLNYGINSQKISVVPNAILKTSDSYSIKKINENNIKFLFVGRLIPRKGIKTLLEAIKIVNKERISNFNIDIVGDGPLFHFCKKYIKNNNLNNCNLLGRISETDLNNIYNESDCFIFPSKFEGFGIVLLEAGINNLAIITNDIPVFKELFSEDEVIYFNKDDAHDLSKKIIDLCSKPQKLIDLQIKAHNKAKDFLWDNIIKQYIDFYKSI